ncbi:Fic family protein [Candidatus Fukatsuia endosymbiont of Tuberolachnus salignus]|uniref:Fic family protein n=1 Tax=Candidatus Fukatsuia endosymbiont of Tuberolachnus salignus TaxID=3077957 RepID=UPI00313D3E82
MWGIACRQRGKKMLDTLINRPSSYTLFSYWLKKESKVMKKPPARTAFITDPVECAQILYNKAQPEILEIAEIALMRRVVDNKGRYLHWQDICDRTRNRDHALVQWSLIKTARDGWKVTLGESEHLLHTSSSYVLTPYMQKITSLIDRRCTSAGLQEIMQGYSLDGTLFKDFIDEESIASSQMEGASTTRVVAKKMLQEGRPARTEGERMIIGNKRLMDLAWERRFDDMSMEILMAFHSNCCQGIDDEKYTPGKIRTGDNVYIAGYNNEVVHTPPVAFALPHIVKALIKWLNTPHETLETWRGYLHPAIKACIAHFCLGYIHPFNDGNGRVARALSYWLLFRCGYEAFRYISISKLLQKAPIKYGKAYLKTETDEMDLTYFISYQCSIFERAIQETLEYVRVSALKIREFDTWLFDHGIMAKLPPVQAILLKSIICFPEKTYTIKEFSEKAGISPTSARQHLERMVKAGVMGKTGGSGTTPAHYASKLSIDKLKNVVPALFE